MPDPASVEANIVADATAVKAWYQSKPLYAGAVIGFVIGQLVYHYLHF